jgi:hypothetical protein
MNRYLEKADNAAVARGDDPGPESWWREIRESGGKLGV